MSKTKEELWSRFWVTNYKNQYLDYSEVTEWLHHYSALALLFKTLNIDIVSVPIPDSLPSDELAQAVIKNSGDVVRRLIDPNKKSIDDNWTYGLKPATKWVVNGPPSRFEGDITNSLIIENTEYELIFAKTSELLSGSGWVGNFWLVEGYFFCFPDDFSNMAGVLFKKDDRDRPIMQILFGERAYELYQEKIKQPLWDAINRRLIR
jgi:hypothetical protein